MTKTVSAAAAGQAGDAGDGCSGPAPAVPVSGDDGWLCRGRALSHLSSSFSGAIGDLGIRGVVPQPCVGLRTRTAG